MAKFKHKGKKLNIKKFNIKKKKRNKRYSSTPRVARNNKFTFKNKFQERRNLQ